MLVSMSRCDHQGWVVHDRSYWKTLPFFDFRNGNGNGFLWEEGRKEGKEGRTESEMILIIFHVGLTVKFSFPSKWNNMTEKYFGTK